MAGAEHPAQHNAAFKHAGKHGDTLVLLHLPQTDAGFPGIQEDQEGLDAHRHRHHRVQPANGRDQRHLPHKQVGQRRYKAGHKPRDVGDGIEVDDALRRVILRQQQAPGGLRHPPATV
ncbi:hypothetical protein SDC9_116168 [bioreactor metagenome]|uniref:Uncharacterized protein n=1 Tax=bioreactor metagenome TaxID=1076179 RepID=A0A645C5K1_9ZZZZ